MKSRLSRHAGNSREEGKIIFPFSIFNARKTIFTIIAAFSTIKTRLLLMPKRERKEDGRVSRKSDRNRVKTLFDFSRGKLHQALDEKLPKPSIASTFHPQSRFNIWNGNIYALFRALRSMAERRRRGKWEKRKRRQKLKWNNFNKFS